MAEPAPGADHLVGDQQDVVLVADLAHPLEVALLRRDAPAGVLERLEDHGRDRLRPLELDPLADLLGGPERVAVSGPVVRVRVRHMNTALGERLERRAQVGEAGRHQGTHRRPVVGDLAGDHLVLLALTGDPEVLARQLQRRLDRFGTARREEDVVEVAGRHVRDPRRELDRAGVRVAPVGHEVELANLALHRLADLGAAVAGVAAEEAREPVEVAVAVIVVDVGALAPGDDRDRVVGVVAPIRVKCIHRCLRASSWRSVPVSVAPGVAVVVAISSSAVALGGFTDVPYKGIRPKPPGKPILVQEFAERLYDSD